MTLLKIEPNVVDDSGNFTFGNVFSSGYFYANGSPFGVTLNYTTHNYVANGSADFTVTSGCTVDNVLVFINGICQAPTDDYTITGTTLTLDAIPVTGSKVQIRELPR